MADSTMRGWQRADLIALLVAAAGVGIYLGVARLAYLRGDDWILLSIVTDPAFGPEDLFRPYGSHVMPFGLATFWAATALFGPAPWWPLVTMTMLLAGVAMFFTWRSIRLLAGADVRAVVPFAVAAWGPAGLAAVMWPAPGVYQVPLWACFSAALYAFLRGRLRGGRWVRWVLLCVALGMVAVETVLLVVPLLFLVAAAWFETGGPVRAIAGAWRSARSLWLAAIALTAAYLAFYFTVSSYSQTLPTQRAGTDLIVEGSLLAIVKVWPALLLSGPWVWTSSMAPTIGTPGLVEVVLFLAAMVVVVRGRRAGWRAWIPMLGLLLLTVLVLSAARLAVFGTSVLLNPYYYVMGLTILAVTLAVAYLPSSLPIDQARRAPPRRVFAASGALLLVGALVAATNYAQAVPQAPGREYLDTARASLRSPTLNSGSPREVFGVFTFGPPFDTAQNTLALAGVEGDWVDVSEDPFILDPSGHRVPAVVPGLAFDLPGGCSSLAEPRALRMPEARQPNRPTYRLHYVATKDTVANVRIGEQEEVSIPLRIGDNTVFFVASGIPSRLTISAPGACLLGLVVGEAVPRG